MKRTSRRLLVALAAGVAVVAAFSIYADVSALRARLAGFGWETFAAALAFAAANYAIRFGRWSLYLRARGLSVPRRRSLLVFLSGFALSITPGKVGELLKSYLLRETDGIPIARSAPIVVAERVSDLLALLILGVAGVAVYGVARGLVIASAACVAFGLLVLAWPRLGHAIIGLVSRPRRLHHLGDRLREFYDGLIDLVRPLRLAWSTALGAVAWLAECVGFAVILAGFADTSVPLGLATLIYATTTLAGAFSFLPGGLGVTEATMTLFLVSSGGVDHATAVAATILTRLATLWFAVLIGIVALQLLRRFEPVADRALEDPPPDGGSLAA